MLFRRLLNRLLFSEPTTPVKGGGDDVHCTLFHDFERNLMFKLSVNLEKSPHVPLSSLTRALIPVLHEVKELVFPAFDRLHILRTDLAPVLADQRLHFVPFAFHCLLLPGRDLRTMTLTRPSGSKKAFCTSLTPLTPFCRNWLINSSSVIFSRSKFS